MPHMRQSLQQHSQPRHVKPPRPVGQDVEQRPRSVELASQHALKLPAVWQAAVCVSCPPNLKLRAADMALRIPPAERGDHRVHRQHCFLLRGSEEAAAAAAAFVGFRRFCRRHLRRLPALAADPGQCTREELQALCEGNTLGREHMR